MRISRAAGRTWSGAGRYGASGSGLKKPQAGTPVLRRGAFPGVQAPCETVGKGRYPIFETTSGVVLGRARILTWHLVSMPKAVAERHREAGGVINAPEDILVVLEAKEPVPAEIMLHLHAEMEPSLRNIRRLSACRAGQRDAAIG